MGLIEGVKLKVLKPIPDDRGWLMEILRCDDELYERFGQVYLTVCYKDVVKAWHYHKIQTDYLAVVKGMAQVALYDMRKDSSTKGEVNEFFIGELNPILIKIPPMVAHGFKAIGENAYMINVPTEPYNRENPDEYRLPWNAPHIPYNWEVRFR